MTTTVWCNKCGVVLNEASDIQPETRTPCPSCGSTTRRFKVCITEGMEISTKVGMKVKRAEDKKPSVEQISGSELNRSTRKIVDKTRIIDRENDLYQETVKDPKTGEIIHHCKEPLSKHVNHGSAKAKP